MNEISEGTKRWFSSVRSSRCKAQDASEALHIPSSTPHHDFLAQYTQRAWYLDFPASSFLSLTCLHKTIALYLTEIDKDMTTFWSWLSSLDSHSYQEHFT